MKLAPSDLIRIPAGVLLAYIGGAAIWKAWASVDGSVVSIIVLLLSVAVGVVFIGIGFVMALGWVRGRPGRPPAGKRGSRHG